jgi:hypothetical protein
MTMRLKLVIGVLALLAFGVGSSYASIGWAGQVYPCSGASFLDSDDIPAYVQVWKGGVTDSPGQGAGIEAFLYYKKATDASYVSVQMTYDADIGNNDEYTGTIPGSATESGIGMNFYCRVHDLTDDTWYESPGDQCGHQPPFTLSITPAIEQEVTVILRVDLGCFSASGFSGGVFFAGDFTGWSACNSTYQMSDPDGDRIFEGSYVFPVGSNPYHEFKFNRNDGNCQWEGSIGNRSFTIDDSQPTYVLPIYVWDNWDCCQPSGPAQIAGPGSYCVTLCLCDEYLVIPLTTPYNPPVIRGITFTPGCMGPDRSACNEECTPGSGVPQWAVVQLPGDGWALQLCLPRTSDALGGCFCMTIDNILAVELAGFDAVPGDGKVYLNWSTRSERDNDGFDILRDGALAHHTASLGNTPTGHNYSWTDVNVENGTHYIYELVSVDLEGNHTHLASVSATPMAGAHAVTEYGLSANYPNPFNPTTSFSYSLKEAGFVTLTVYDIAGRAVAELVKDNRSAGTYAVTFDGSNLPSGIYYYRLQVNDFSATHKMVLLK